MRAVVVGAGIGGFATTIALERAGVESIVIERAPQLQEAGFGLVVSANAVTALRTLGLRDSVAARGTRVRRAEIRNPRGDLLTLIDYQALGWETYGVLRTELQQAMLEVAPAARLRLGTTCIDVTEDGQVLLEGAAVPLVGAAHPPQIAFKELAGPRYGIVLLEEDGSRPVELTRGQPEPGVLGGFSWSPDGSRLVYAGARLFYARASELAVIDAGTGRTLVRAAGGSGEWSPDGTLSRWTRLAGST